MREVQGGHNVYGHYGHNVYGHRAKMLVCGMVLLFYVVIFRRNQKEILTLSSVQKWYSSWGGIGGASTEVSLASVKS